ncbi:MAG: DUF4859 domain-containing protein [Bacteroidales bacterium]|nr:DUF4859 domain-containing protein [Bacteroidales bacterium]
MKKSIWSMMLMAAVAFAFAACQKPEAVRPTPEPDPTPTPTPTPTPGPDDDSRKPDCDWADYLISVEFTADETTDYGVGTVDWATLKHNEGKTVFEILGYDSYDELAEELGEDPLSGDVQYFGNDPVTGYDITEPFNTNGAGYWCNGVGGLSSWGDDASRIYTEDFFSDETGFLSNECTVGVRPDHIKAGDSYVVRMVWQKTEGNEVTRVGLEAKVTIEAFVDPEAGQYDATKRQTGTFDVDPVELTVPVNVFYDGVQADLSVVQKYLQLTKYEITQLGEAVYDDESGELLKGLDVTNVVNGEAVDSNAGGLGGNWMQDPVTVGAWGVDTGSFFVEFHASFDAIFVSVGTMPGEEDAITDLVSALVGQTAEYKQVVTYIPEFDAAPTVINLTYNIHFVEAE